MRIHNINFWCYKGVKEVLSFAESSINVIDDEYEFREGVYKYAIS